MDPLLLKYYNRELQYMREMGGEFAEEFPKIAGRLGLNAFECADPYVERLLEGFAFLAARVQLKVDAEFPRFTQHFLEMVYPNYLAPVPSMAIVQLNPEHNDTSLQNGVVIPRGSQLRSQIGKGEQTACEYSTAHEVTLWPVATDRCRIFIQCQCRRQPGDSRPTGLESRSAVAACAAPPVCSSVICHWTNWWFICAVVRWPSTCMSSSWPIRSTASCSLAEGRP